MTQPSVMTAEYYRMVTLKVPQGLNERLMKAAAERKTSISELIRECCAVALATKDAIKG